MLKTLKKLFRTAVVFMLVLSMVACSQKPADTDTSNDTTATTDSKEETGTSEETESEEPVTINYWTVQTQSERQEKIRAMLDVFEILNPDIKVNLLAVDENEFSAQMAAVGNFENRPNLIESSKILSLSFSQEGLIDYSANEAVVEAVGKDEFIDGALDTVQLEDGSYFGIPFNFFAQGIWYRKDWFEEAGLEAPDTWENIMAAAEYFYNPQEKQYGVLVGTMPENFTQQVFAQFATSNGAHLFDKDGNLIIDTPEFKETVEYYNQLAKYNPPGPQTWRARDYYIQGKLPMFFYSTYIMDDLSTAEAAAGSLTSENFSDLEGGEFDQKLVDNTGFVPVISKKSGSSYGEVYTLSIIKNDDDRKTTAANRLAQFFYEEENYVPYVHVAVGIMPVMVSTIEGDAFLNDPKGAYAKYGSDKILGIVNGIGNMKDFLSVDEQPMPKSSTILAKNILAQLLYNITIEGKDIDSEIEKAKKEMERAISQ